jgi:hypothetical protein
MTGKAKQNSPTLAKTVVITPILDKDFFSLKEII